MSEAPTPERKDERTPLQQVLRVMISVISIILLIDALVLAGRGVLLSVHAYRDLFDPTVERPLLPALEAVDLFFLALVFIIMAIGLVQLFVGDLRLVRSPALSWLKIDSFTALKVLLWDTFLVTLLVLFVTKLVQVEVMDWSVLILPTAILALTVSSYLLKKPKH